MLFFNSLYPHVNPIYNPIYDVQMKFMIVKFFQTKNNQFFINQYIIMNLSSFLNIYIFRGLANGKAA